MVYYFTLLHKIYNSTILNMMYSYIMNKRCKHCDEVRPLDKKNACERCKKLREMKPRLPKEETFSFSLDYESRRKR